MDRRDWARGFTFAELMVCIVIVLLLVSITVTYFEGPRDDARRSVARIEAERITQMIHAWQLEKRTNYRSNAVPPGYHGKPIDPWGQPYRIDPAAHAVSSSGPDGVFDSSDDVVASWEVWRDGALTALPAPSVAEGPGGSALLAWPVPAGLKSLALRRSGPDGERLIALASDASGWRDGGLVSRATYTYRLEGTDANGRPLASPEAHVFVPASSPPSMNIHSTLLPTGRLHVRVEALAHGSELAQLAVGTRLFPLRGVSQSVEADLILDKAGAPVSIALTDRAGSRVTTDVR